MAGVADASAGAAVKRIRQQPCGKADRREIVVSTRPITKPGVYAVSAADYHADTLCAVPTLSASIAHVLLDQSPLHAWWSHPRLNPAYEPDEDERFDIGTACHAYLLEGESGFVIVDAPDWRTKDARAQRDAARAEGKVPLLTDRWADVQAMAKAARRQLAEYEEQPIPLTGGKAEQTLVWEEEGIWCRARLDWLHDGHRFVDDLKTAGGSAQPDAWTRGPLFANGGDLQAAFYLRGIKAVFGVEATFRFVVVETAKPFALSVIGLAPSALDLAERKVTAALAAWRYCLEANRWPGYPTCTAYAEAPGWEEARWMERQAHEPPRDDGRPLAEQLFEESS